MSQILTSIGKNMFLSQSTISPRDSEYLIVNALREQGRDTPCLISLFFGSHYPERCIAGTLHIRGNEDASFFENSKILIWYAYNWLAGF